MALLQYKCPNCGGALEYDSEASRVKCPYCDTEFPVEAFAALDAELNETVEDNIVFTSATTDGYSASEMNGMVSYLCESCGAEIVTEATTSASSCPYCDNPVVMMGNLSGDLKPELILPFKLNKEAAMAGFKNHLTGKKLLPKAFVETNHLQEVKGMYVPFWLYDSTADASIKYSATISHSYVEGDYDVEDTEHYSVFRSGRLSFENVPVDGSKKLPNDLTESLEPFDFSQAVPFQTAYMAGFYADKYDVTSDECVKRAGERMTNSTEDEFRKTVMGYDSVSADATHINVKSGRAKYVLLPVWILTTKWNDAIYTFAMNGQTGKFIGNLPCDKKLKNKIFWKTFAISAAIALAIRFIIAIPWYIF